MHARRALALVACIDTGGRLLQATQVDLNTGGAAPVAGLEALERPWRFVGDTDLLTLRLAATGPGVLRVRDEGGAMRQRQSLDPWTPGSPSPSGHFVPLFDTEAQAIAVWDTQTGETRLVQRCDEPIVGDSIFAWSGDGSAQGLLGCGREEVVVRLPGAEITLDRGPLPYVPQLEFNASGRRLLHGISVGVETPSYAVLDGESGASMGDPRPVGLHPSARLTWRYGTR